MSERRIEDARGRQLTLRDLTMLDRLRLYKALGAELAMNEVYLGVASLAAAVTAIDGVPLLFPASEAAVENAVERLGEDGIEAVALASAPDDPATVKALAGN
ncbi:hypothetical protein [Acidiphilium acidophilum]|jgi:hypothetical protein|uniref:Uncharacterized protein n=1 Tax=Acidiphilium acidophilum TaxID=76588 RepID=A0AAW9DVS6_ACIAO|nr:hypothetical protein [Acidiphilium acidophilum]MDX5932702.1 hypothetical protein [Acidiphilium acidophilum]MEE3500190.1 hypothetical protein [Acidiphilium acidophilum]GBQ08800.1 hypothetical protein AA700_0935 [Acidiphilium acidophilum DSM 700]